MRADDPAADRRVFRASLLQLVVVFVALLADLVR
jgi:hypothetical protein